MELGQREPLPVASTLYLFLDEGGNLDFSPSGSSFFTLTSVAMFRPFVIEEPMSSLRFDLIEQGVALERFHATEDKQQVRDKVFEIIEGVLPRIRIDTVVAEKRKAAPTIRADERFYPELMGYLLRYVLNRLDSRIKLVVVITDTIPINRKRKAIEKAVKQSLSRFIPRQVPWTVHHHDSRSCCGLQVADYVNWAIFRRHERGDNRSHELIKAAIRSEFEIFKLGNRYWY